MKEAPRIILSGIMVSGCAVTAQPRSCRGGIMRVDEAQFGIRLINRKVRGCLFHIHAGGTPLVAGKTGGLDARDRMHEAAWKGNLRDIGKSGIGTGSTIHDTSDIDRTVDDAGLRSIKAMEIPETLAGMASGALGADFTIVIPMAECLGCGVGMCRPEPVGNRLVIIDIDFSWIERTRTRKGKRNCGSLASFILSFRIALSKTDISDENNCQ